MIKKIMLPVMSICVLSSPVFADDGLTCKAFTETMTKRVVEIFHDRKQNEDAKKQSLSALFQEAVDTDWIGQTVLGAYWRSATDEQKKQYLEAYKTYLTDVYISKFDNDAGFSVDAIKLVSLKQQDDEQEAKTLIQRKGQPDVAVNYMLDEKKDKCQVHDISIEGISLLISERSEFQTLASSSGIEGVIKAIKKQIAAIND